MTTIRPGLVGLVPAAGRAMRLGELPQSKEVLPLGPAAGGAARLVCHDLLDSYREAGVERAYVVLREGKWDVPAALGDGRALGVDLAYLVVPPTAGVPFTLDRAYPFVRGQEVALGFPDILLTPRDLLARLRAHHHAAGSEVSLALVPCDRPEASDLVEVDGTGRVMRFEIKPRVPTLALTWVLALWTPRFTDFLHEWVAAEAHRATARGREAHVGNVFADAVARGLAVSGLELPDGRSLDIGTPESLARAAAEGWAAR
ncbi:MAG TPA: sugar phosphate nucleotidyltransferase [Thermoanaerobaculia bacterium]|nr:sugar phosphate nucleotidyltransferase [Thermoanaerobaculia bacterium]